jgi:iron complex outermembrane receptor protein
MRAPHERQAGLYSVEVSCPNAQFQGEYLGSNATCHYWDGYGTPGPGTTATGYRNDAITPSRGGTPYKIAETDDNFVDRKVFAATLHNEFDLGKGLSLVSVTDYQYGSKAYSEGDGTPDKGNYFYQGARIRQGTQELRLLGDYGAHQFVLGAFGMLIKGDYYGGFTTPFDDYVPRVSFTQKTRSFAFFAQDEWTVTDTIKLIGGVRYWNDQRKGAYFGTEPFSGVSLIFNDKEVGYSSFGVVQPGTGLLVGPKDAKPTFSGITARAEIDYKPNSRTLLYLSYNRGSKSGGFTFSTGTPIVGAEISALNGIPYRPETLQAIEAGVKMKLLPRMTFNLTGYYYFYHDYQAFAQYGLVQTVVNLNARNKGLEADITSNPIDGLTLQFSGSLMDSSVKNVPLPDGSIAASHRLPQAPGFSATLLARYEFAIAGGKASLQADMLHSGRFCFTVLCAPVEREGSYNVANLRIGFGPEDGAWELAAFVNNVNDAQYRVYAFDESLVDGTVAGVFAKPRTWGLSATVRFGERH